MAPAVPLDRLLEGVRLPTGQGAREAEAGIKARSEAVPVPAAEARMGWRSVPVRVTVTLEGYRDLTFDFRLDEDPLPRVLEPLGEDRIR